MNFKIALAQVDSVIGDVKKNVRKHVDCVRKSVKSGADLVVFPELSLTGYTVRDTNWDVALKLPAEKELGDLVKLSRSISIILGGIEESEEYGIFNSAFLLEKGKVHRVHRKIYPPTYGMFEEMRYFSSGKTAQAFDTGLGRMGVLICEDLWHLPLPYVLARDGAEVIIVLAASPTRLGGDEGRPAIARVNTENHKVYARLLGAYLVFCNRVGFEDGVNFWGGSEVIDPAGETVVQAKLFEEDLVFAHIDGNELRRARKSSRHFLDDDERLVMEELERIRRERRTPTR